MSHIEEVRNYFKAWIDRDANAILSALDRHATYRNQLTRVPIRGQGHLRICHRSLVIFFLI